MKTRNDNVVSDRAAFVLAPIVGLFACQGRLRYGGEAVSQVAHALQAATLASEGGEPDTVVAAALLHDIGHLAPLDDSAGNGPASHDMRHEHRAMDMLRGVFPESVLAPIRLHVDAKRYLCATDPQYRSILSPESVRSLALQGGAFDAAQASAFASQPYAEDAIRVRRYDDLAKDPAARTPELQDFMAVLARVLADDAIRD